MVRTASLIRNFLIRQCVLSSDAAALSFSSDAAFQRDAEEFLCFHGQHHGQFVDVFAGIAPDNQSDSVFGRNATLVAIEQLVFGNLGSRGFVLHGGVVICHVDVGESVSAAVTAQQQ